MTDLPVVSGGDVGVAVADRPLGDGGRSYLLQLRWRRDNVEVSLSPTGCDGQGTF